MPPRTRTRRVDAHGNRRQEGALRARTATAAQVERLRMRYGEWSALRRGTLFYALQNARASSARVGVLRRLQSARYSVAVNVQYGACA